MIEYNHRKGDNMRRFLQKFAVFMQGRYGYDKLNAFIGVVFFILWFINIFVFNFFATIILDIILLLLIALILFRTFSRNINKRSLENRKFCVVYDKVKNFCNLTVRKFKDRKDFRYLKCPMCKAQLRVKNKKGVHTVRCPRCGSEFEKKI